MSVASEFPPDVYIPAGARTRSLRTVSRSRTGAPETDVLVLDVFAPAAPAAAVIGAEVTDLDRWRHHYVGAQVGGRRRIVADLRIRPSGELAALTDSAALPEALRPIVAPAPLAASASAPIRLTRRGVAVLAVASVLLALAVVAVSWLSAAGSASASATDRSAGPAVVTVHDGDSLWSIAAAVAPTRDPRVVVDDLRKRNHLTGDTVTPGQQLRVR